MFLFGFVLVLTGFVAGLVDQSVNDRFHEVKEDDADNTDEGYTDWSFRNDELSEVEDHARDHVSNDEVDIHHGVHAAVYIMKILFIDANNEARDNDQHHAKKGLGYDVDHTLADFSAGAEIEEDKARDEDHYDVN